MTVLSVCHTNLIFFGDLPGSLGEGGARRMLVGGAGKLQTHAVECAVHAQ